MLGRVLNRRLGHAGARLACTTTTGGRFDGKVAVITGSTDGIGLAIAERLGGEGASVVVSSRKEANVEKAVQGLKEKGLKVTGIPCNVSDASRRTCLLEKALDEFGRIDMVVTNAAASPAFGPIFKTTEEQWDKTFDTNVKATFFLVKEALPELAKTKGGIVLISTVLAFRTYPLLGAYTISKAANMAMVKAMAPQCGSKGVRINCVAPGMIDTQFSSALTENKEIYMPLFNDFAIKRNGRPDEVAASVAFLLSDDATFISGETIVPAGGYPTRM